MAAYEIKKHNCANCGKEEKYIICSEKTLINNKESVEEVEPLQPTYIDSSKVEVEYECKQCHNKNKVVVEL